MSAVGGSRADKPPVGYWLKFNAVGAVGMAVQFAAAAGLREAGIPPVPAVALAVEAAVLNNFIWHERWTWRDRPSPTVAHRFRRLAGFHLSNGMVSILGGMVLMRVLHEWCGLHFQLVNLISIVVCSFVNFFLAHYLVFKANAE